MNEPERPAASAPIGSAERVHALDALRGVALLGILIANVRQMFLPWDIADLPLAPGLPEWLAWLDWQLYYAFVSQKFLTIFSLLFGIGFALQARRLTQRGQGFAAIYLRRVAFLALFGIAHGLLLYPAEVLMPYALTAVLLLAVHRLSMAALLRVALVLLGVMTLWAYQLGALGEVYPVTMLVATGLLVVAMMWSRRRGWTAACVLWLAIVSGAGAMLTWELHTDSDARPEETSVAADLREARAQLQAMQGTDVDAWPKEYRARREGGFAALVALHADQYALIVLYFAILLLWRTLALFMVGAAAFRSGLLDGNTPGGTASRPNASAASWRRVSAIGLGVGVPLSVLATILQTLELRGVLDVRLSQLLHEVGSLPLAAGMAGAVFIWHARSARRWLWDRFEAAGRMALTNYIGQSVVMAALAEPWGLSLYGKVAAPLLTVLALAVFLLLALASHAWLARYRMGPLEWLWRCGTYWRWLPNR